MMTITIEQHGPRHYRADCSERPGAPLVGLGRTKVEAVAHLLYIMTKQKGTLTINNKLWRRPVGYSKR